MIYLRFFLTKLAILFLASADASSETSSIRQEGTQFEWENVDVVTNDYQLINRVREITKIAPGTLMTFRDPRLKRACDEVRAEFLKRNIACTSVIMSQNKALYVVQMDLPFKPAKLPICASPDNNPLVTLRETIRQDHSRFIALEKTKDEGQYVDSKGVLRPRSELRAAEFETYHKKSVQLFAEIERGLNDCDPVLRESALLLMNFVGDAEAALHAAEVAIHDDDSNVRNTAFRLISDFMASVPKSRQRSLITSACQALRSPYFLDRNKALFVIDGLLRLQPAVSKEITEHCRLALTETANTSSSEQLGMPAKMILDLLAKDKFRKQ